MNKNELIKSMYKNIPTHLKGVNGHVGTLLKAKEQAYNRYQPTVADDKNKSYKQKMMREQTELFRTYKEEIESLLEKEKQALYKKKFDSDHYQKLTFLASYDKSLLVDYLKSIGDISTLDILAMKDDNIKFELKQITKGDEELIKYKDLLGSLEHLTSLRINEECVDAFSDTFICQISSELNTFY